MGSHGDVYLADKTARQYRSRIYNRYVTLQGADAVVGAQENLKSRRANLNRIIRDYFPEDTGAAIIDLGCGGGVLVRCAREFGYSNIFGVDWSEEQAAAGRAIGVEDIRVEDLGHALQSVPSSSVDVVIAFDVIEHCTKGELIEMADEVFRVLRTDGRWIIHTVNASSPFSGRLQYGDITHETAFTSRSMRQLLLVSGFRSISCYEDDPVIHGAVSGLRWMLWRLVRILLRFSIAVETGCLDEDVFTQNLIAVASK